MSGDRGEDGGTAPEVAWQFSGETERCLPLAAVLHVISGKAQ